MDSRVSTYKRLIASAEAEQILSNSKVCLDIPLLRPHIIGSGVDKTTEIYRYLKYASQHGGFISSKYSSKGKTTARMFTEKGNLNLITLSDERILKAIHSRYEGGYIVCLDYSNFEPSIIESELGSVVPSSIHDWACNLLPDVPRKEIKLWNMQLMYSSYFDGMVDKLYKTMTNNYTLNVAWIKEYFSTFDVIRKAMNEWLEPRLDTYYNKGFVINSYGRKIYPKNNNTIFNNTIQSVGSEILVNAIIDLNKFLQGKEIHILFHRFDSLYIDISKSNLFKHLEKIKSIMEGVNQGVNLSVRIEVGKNMATLKELDIG